MSSGRRVVGLMLASLVVVAAFVVHGCGGDSEGPRMHIVLSLDMDLTDPEYIAQREKNGKTDVEMAAEFQEAAVQIIRRRLDELGTRNVDVSTQTDRKIQVSFAGAGDLARARTLVLRRGLLAFHIIAGQDATDETFIKIDDHLRRTSKKRFISLLQKSATGRGVVVPVANIDAVRALVKEAAAVPGVIPEDMTITFGGAPKSWDKEDAYRIYLMNSEASQSRPTLTDAVARRDDASAAGSYQILFGFDESSGHKFGEITEAHIGDQLAIVIDGVVVSAPNIQSKISGSGSITGDFSQQEATDLAIILRGVPLPVPLIEESATITEPENP